MGDALDRHLIQSVSPHRLALQNDGAVFMHLRHADCRVDVRLHFHAPDGVVLWMPVVTHSPMYPAPALFIAHTTITREIARHVADAYRPEGVP